MPLQYTKCSLRDMIDIKQILPWSSNYNIFLIFVTMALKLAKVGQNFSSFNTCPSLPSVKRDDKKKIHCLNAIDAKARFTFLKIANSVTKPH